MSSSESAAEAIVEGVAAPAKPTAPIDFDALPPLSKDPSFWGMGVAQFLGAFNDNLFKQLVLLLSFVPLGFDKIGELPGTSLFLFGAPLALAMIVPSVGPMFIMLGVAAFEQGQASDRQGLAGIVFAAPFILTTGYAGYLADRYRKRSIVVACKLAEVIIMAAGAVAFTIYSRDQSLAPLYVVLFLMGAHSGFFGPAKYGILPEMLRPSDLSRANGLLLTTTFMAIILGTFVAGQLLGNFRDQLWVGSAACISVAVAGTIAALFVRKLPAADPNLPFDVSALTVPHEMRALLRQDRPLWLALLVSSAFWLLAGMVMPAVNSLGMLDHMAGAKSTSLLVAVVSIGIAIGGSVGGILSGDKVDFRVMRVGCWGMVVCLFLLAVPTWDGARAADVAANVAAGGWFAGLPRMGESPQWLGYPGSMITLVFLGVFTGCFAVPLQVFMQSRPPEGKKGRMIAVMNLANWVGILLAGVIYEVLSRVIEGAHWPRCTMFIFIGAITLSIAMFYHPKTEELH